MQITIPSFVTRVPENAVLVTIDVIGLYTHIPRDEGIKATHDPSPSSSLSSCSNCSQSGTYLNLMADISNNWKGRPWVRPTPPTTLTSSCPPSTRRPAHPQGRRLARGGRVPHQVDEEILFCVYTGQASRIPGRYQPDPREYQVHHVLHQASRSLGMRV